MKIKEFRALLDQFSRIYKAGKNTDKADMLDAFSQALKKKDKATVASVIKLLKNSDKLEGRGKSA